MAVVVKGEIDLDFTRTLNVEDKRTESQQKPRTNATEELKRAVSISIHLAELSDQRCQFLPSNCA